MPVSPAIRGDVLARMQSRRSRDEAELQERRRRLYAAIPELRDIESAMQAAVSRILTTPPDLMDDLRRAHTELQNRRRALLRSHGYALDSLDPIVHCPRCFDAGFVGGVACECLTTACAREERRRLSSMLDLKGQTFDAFKLSYYDDQPSITGLTHRQNAQSNLKICRGYAADFTTTSGNLLMNGDPGLGKTFLSAAIAGVVADAGHSVVYDSVTTVIAVMEREKFDRGDTADGSDKYLQCDLLILDDLGAEMSTTFSHSALYTLVNHRLNAGLPTIINTNFTMDELQSKYSPALVSRLNGQYQLLSFTGNDIRIKLKKR